MRAKPGAVLFDCDGVLVDSEPPARRIVWESLRDHGLEMDAEEMERRFTGGTMFDTLAQLRALGIELPDDWPSRIYSRLYAELAEGVPLIPGVETVLDRLDAAGIPYAVGSNGRPEKMRITLGQHPSVWARLEGRLFSGQELGHPKPDPKLYLIAAAHLGVAPDACVVIDDSVNGCTGGIDAGMRVLGFAPEGTGAALAGLGAEVFRHMDELPALLGL